MLKVFKSMTDEREDRKYFKIEYFCLNIAIFCSKNFAEGKRDKSRRVAQTTTTTNQFSSF